jgi:hypothetical protein
MLKYALGILIAGLICGCIVGGVMCYIALDHNPQMVFTQNPGDLFIVFYLWTAAVSFPFTIVAFVLLLLSFGFKVKGQ